MNKPEKTFRLGSANVSVFLNESGQSSFRTAVVERRYLDGGKWKSSHSWTATELADAVAAMQRALDYLVDC